VNVPRNSTLLRQTLVDILLGFDLASRDEDERDASALAAGRDGRGKLGRALL
jgi:hypothetical protein